MNRVAEMIKNLTQELQMQYPALALETNSAGIAVPTGAANWPHDSNDAAFFASGTSSMGGAGQGPQGRRCSIGTATCSVAAHPVCSREAVNQPNGARIMSNTPAVFNFNSNEVRVIDQDGNPWFIAADVCKALDYANVSDAVATHLDDDERMTIANGDSHSGKRGGARLTTIINESGLYALVLRSRKPEARKFAKWVTSEVLPTIRKTGKYEAAPYSVNPNDKLTKEQADTLRNMLTDAAEKAHPDDTKKQGVMIRAGWSKLKSHFKVSYRDIPQGEFTEAVSLLSRHVIEGEYLPKPTVTVNTETASISDADLLRAATAELMKPGRIFLTIFGKGTTGQPHPILYPVSEGARMLTDDEIIQRISKADGFPAPMLPALISAAASRLQARLS